MNISAHTQTQPTDDDKQYTCRWPSAYCGISNSEQHLLAKGWWEGLAQTLVVMVTELWWWCSDDTNVVLFQVMVMAVTLAAANDGDTNNVDGE